MQIFFVVSKTLCIKFNKMDVFIKTCNGIRYLVLFGDWCYDNRFCNIKNLISRKKVSYIVLIIIMQEAELTHIVLCL